jgi:GNAT superfamily N-acetyltransferase
MIDILSPYGDRAAFPHETEVGASLSLDASLSSIAALALRSGGGFGGRVEYTRAGAVWGVGRAAILDKVSDLTMTVDVTAPVRFAILEDLDRCARCDATVRREAIARKIGCDEVLVAESAGGMVGYLRLEYLWSKLPFIGLIHVVDAHRGAGVGRAMLVFLEGYLRERGHGVLLSSSMSDAAEAQQWHRRTGFEECGFLAGVNPGAIGEVFFRKRLD